MSRASTTSLLPRALARASRRHLTRHPLRFGLAIVGIALGVAVVVAIDLVNTAARRSFRLSTEAVAGLATHQISAGSDGLDERVFSRLLALPGAPAMAPLVEDFVLFRSKSVTATTDDPRSVVPLRLLGVDPFSERAFRPFLGGALFSDSSGGARGTGALIDFFTRPGAVVIARPAAEALGLAVGDEFEVEAGSTLRTLHLAAVFDLEPGNEAARAALSQVMFADISTAQETLGRLGRLTRVEVLIPNDDEDESAASNGHRSPVVIPNEVRDLGGGAHEARLLQALTAALPPEAVLTRVASRPEALDEITRAFRLNLRALSLLALVCGAFLIHNTMSFSVVERRSLWGLLRSVGATRGEILRLVLAEAVALGAIGSLLGAIAGLLLGHALVGLVTGTIQDLYFTVAVREAIWGPGAASALARGLLIGIVASLVASASPALEATGVSPRAALTRSLLESGARRKAKRSAVAGVLMLAAGALLLALSGTQFREALSFGSSAGGTGGAGSSLAGSFAGLFLLLLGTAALAPGMTVVAGALAARLSRLLPGVLPRMAARGLVTSLSRTAVAIAALSLAVATALGVDLMIRSFRDTVTVWLSGALAADLYVAPATSVSGPSGSPRLPGDLGARLATIPSVSAVRSLRTATVEGAPTGTQKENSLPWRISGSDLDRTAFARLQLREGEPDTAWPAFARGEGALVSEPFATRRGLGAGSTLRWASAGTVHELPIVGVFRDYGSDQGFALLAEARFRQAFPEAGVAALALELAPGASAEPVLATARAFARPGERYFIESSAALRAESLRIFDRTFRVTGVLGWLTLATAFLGVFAAATALQLERAREFAVLRAHGLTRGQLARLVLGETSLLGAVAGLYAMPVGLLLAAVMVFVINRRSFGWSMELSLDAAPFVEALAVSILAAVLASVIPARRMARVAPADALRGAE